MKPLKTSGKLVLCTQFWAGDRDAAMRNARRIADNESKFRDDAEFLFVSRFDSTRDGRTRLEEVQGVDLDGHAARHGLAGGM